MVWVETDFERHLKERLLAELGAERKESLCSQFVTARDKVLNEIKQIPGVESQLSDHGPDHIRNVFDNVVSLISTDHETHKLSARDLYLLALVVLFHDVGNLFGREDHHLKIGKVYDWARGTDSKVRHEKTLVLQAARAHTGITSNGGRDTLAEVAEADHFDGKPIRLRTIAGILRLADELAEGPQRTTDFYRIHCGYEEGAVQFHEYAACTHVSADRASERIRLTYELQLNDFDLPADTGRLKDLAGFIDFITHRISKLDDERRYTRFYCPLLDVFKQTDVAINFAHGSAPLGYGVSFRLDDLVVPGHRAHTFDTRYPGKCETAIQVAENAVKAATEGAAL